MFVNEFKKRIRYSETDKMGYLYYGNYASLYEIGRVELIRSLGITYREMEDKHNVMLPVVSLESRFLNPIYYDEQVTIKTILSELPSKLISFNHEIYNQENKLVNKGIVKLFFIDMVSDRRISIPEFLLTPLSKYF